MKTDELLDMCKKYLKDLSMSIDEKFFIIKETSQKNVYNLDFKTIDIMNETELHNLINDLIDLKIKELNIKYEDV